MMRAEDRLQSRARMYLNVALPPPGYWCSIITERKQSPQAGERLKARGQKRGVSDIMLWYLGKFIGIELKVATKTSEAQDGFRDAMVANGFAYAVVRSVVELDDLLRYWGIPVLPSMRVAAMHHDAALSVAAPAKPPRAARKPRAWPPKRPSARAKAAWAKSQLP